MNNILNFFNSKDENTSTPDTVVKTAEIPLPNKNTATAVFPTSTDNPDSVIKALNLRPYKAIFLNLGNPEKFDDALVPKLTQVFSRGIATAALEANALIVDEGIDSGVISLMGMGVSDRGNKTMLVGIAPANDVSYPTGPTSGLKLELNHSHFILIEKDDPANELAIMSAMVSLLIYRPEIKDGKRIVRKVPALAILTGGNDTTKQMLLLSVRQKINVIVVQGSGGLADDIVAAMSSKTAPEDPAMAEIVADGQLLIQSFNDPIEKIRKDIISKLGVDDVLMQAWETFADYDLNANIQQKKFDRIQKSIIIIGVVGTALAIGKEVMKSVKDPGDLVIGTSKALYVILILIPITLTILITIVNRFKQGNKWLLLRAAAEAIKREIFRYRTRTNDYSGVGENPVLPAQQLSKTIETITTRIMRTEVNTSAFVAYDKKNGFPPYMFGAEEGDDGLSSLSADRYVEVRLGDQLSYFKKRSIKLGKQLNWISVISFIIGGIGTFLAAIDQPVWIALTTTIVGALGTYLAYMQTENILTKFNQTATNLSNIKAWWMALTPSEQISKDNINNLVAHTEEVLQEESDGWVQQMQNALAELRKKQETKPETDKANPDKANGKQAEPTKVGEGQPAVDGAAVGEPPVAKTPAETPAAETPVSETPTTDTPVAETSVEAKAEGETPVGPEVEKTAETAPEASAKPDVSTVEPATGGIPEPNKIKATNGDKPAGTNSTFVQVPLPLVEQEEETKK